MKSLHPHAQTAVIGLCIALVLLLPNAASAHCDGMDGPVVKAAQKALATGDVNLVLVWVQKKDEKEIRHAFERALAVRKLGHEAQELADLYFFETLVRVHRAGEGAPYTGLKPAGRDLGPALPLADKALETGKIEPLRHLIMETTEKSLAEKFNHAMKASTYSPSDIDRGREFVHAYVVFIHMVEGMYNAAAHPAHGHAEENVEKTEPVKEHVH